MVKSQKKTLTPAKNVKADILVPRLVFILSALFLILFGLVMVFSASNVEAINQQDNPYSYLAKQSLFVLIGIFFAIVIWRFIPYSV